MKKQPKCTKPEIKEMIEMMGYGFLIQTLGLDHALFCKTYKTRQLTKAIRSRLRSLVIEHHQSCSVCQAAARGERDKDEMIKRLLRSRVLLFPKRG